VAVFLLRRTREISGETKKMFETHIYSTKHAL